MRKGVDIEGSEQGAAHGPQGRHRYGPVQPDPGIRGSGYRKARRRVGRHIQSYVLVIDSAYDQRIQDRRRRPRGLRYLADRHARCIRAHHNDPVWRIRRQARKSIVSRNDIMGTISRTTYHAQGCHRYGPVKTYVGIGRRRQRIPSGNIIYHCHFNILIIN